ncbi:MAG TPA: hypothetical protein PKM88_06600 [bacterium]|nr:hypothetical protein [bacterium]
MVDPLLVTMPANCSIGERLLQIPTGILTMSNMNHQSGILEGCKVLLPSTTMIMMLMGMFRQKRNATMAQYAGQAVNLEVMIDGWFGTG